MRFRSSEYLVALLQEVQAAADRIARGDPAGIRSALPQARRDYARLSARLDASPLTDDTADRVDAGIAPAVAGLATGAEPVAQDGGWAHVLKLDTAATQDIAGVEYSNLLAAFDAEPAAAEAVLDDPLEALHGLHEVICRGLAAPDVIGRARRSAQAVHDGAQGMVLYNAPPPEALPALLDELAVWVTEHGESLPGVIVAGAVHERLLEWQPFEAANGRLARAAARVILRARRVDRHGLAVAERLLAVDPGAYHGEVAATIRRRGDLGLWLERYAEAVAAGLEDAAALVGPRPSAPERASALFAELSVDGPVTVADFARAAAQPLPAAREDLLALCAAGIAQRQPGSRGLRYRRAAIS
ncbi:MAG TPA: Fic family protein [Egibacteraceae bacterium]|nr:Fic family protein [Egibacteraceae bacterium]